MKSKILTATLSLTIGLSGFTYTTASAETLKDIQQKQAENHIEKSKKNKQVKEVQGEQDQLLKELDKLEASLKKTTGDIQTKKNEIAETKANIAQLQNEIAVLEKRIEERDALLKNRVRNMYENGGAVKYLDVLLGSQGFGDFLDRMISLNIIAEQDKTILEEHKRDKEAVEKKKQQVESQLASLNSKLSDLNSLNSQLKDNKAKKNKIMKSLRSEEQHLHDDIGKLVEKDALLADQEKAIKAEIARAKKEAAERARREAAEKAAAAKRAAQQKEAAERAAREKAKQPSRHSSPAPAPAPAPAPEPSYEAPSAARSFIFPSAGYVTSQLGSRWNKFHAGIDIAKAGYVPIHASASGTVARSYTSSTYGNVVFLSHYIDGQLYTTVYAHMRDRAVSTGQTVSQGQTLGHMGSTGHSTGQHLHFELHKGPWNVNKTNAVNPLPYIQ
ncbi:peptidoglycan DD-metalloendopeptidase family protein [Fictibacillus sp. WQ 8-8]|uniref:murein hydrolase activator EnvC family protein n=1 Tax=Fictibacillus sp. WQ 8-8 TaxID=2938788 RepID=UPI0021090B8C|nr:peptidoglycan DD-metalloendopeptidase family protein [Fictibacillus sp. WQ 8-8]MCQ6264128.1 peptidoglycan DD-metalloendopeptidase family protein [Fictibacillus sp. WQ 8-8]